MKSLTKKNFLYFSFVLVLLLAISAILAVSDGLDDFPEDFFDDGGFDDDFDSGGFDDDFDTGGFDDDFDSGGFEDDFDEGGFDSPPEEPKEEFPPDDFDDGFDEPEFPPDDIPPEDIPPFPEPPKPEPPSAEGDLFRLFVSAIRYPDPFSLSQYGNEVPIYIYFDNNGNQNLDNVKVSVVIQELGIRASQGPDDLDKAKRAREIFVLELPENTEPGAYSLRFAFSAPKEADRILYRELNIID